MDILFACRVIGLFLALSWSGKLVTAETCEGFSASPVTVPVHCIVNASRTSTCRFTFADQNCGRGVRLEYYTNCPTLARQCCKPCPHKVIIEPDCTADYCIYGAYTPGLLYNVSDCTYIADRWSGCHSEVLLRQREDPLLVPLGGAPAHCSPTNTLQKVCTKEEVNPDDPSDPIAIFTPRDPKPGPASPSTLKGAITEKEIVNSTNIPPVCLYNSASTWSSCHHKTQTRRLTRQLNPSSDPEKCEATKTETRPCFTKGGKERCFYKKWSRWSSCENFIQQRRRDILYGRKSDCTRTIKIRVCQPAALKRRHEPKTKNLQSI